MKIEDNRNNQMHVEIDLLPVGTCFYAYKDGEMDLYIKLGSQATVSTDESRRVFNFSENQEDIWYENVKVCPVDVHLVVDSNMIPISEFTKRYKQKNI